MRFSTKIFLATSVVSCLGVAAASVTLFQISKHLYVHQYQTLYRERLDLVAREFVTLEEMHGQVALNAARVVKELERQRPGRLQSSDLAKLAKELNVDGIIIVSSKGGFERSNTPELSDKNLFEFCPQYRGLVTGETSVFQTPLLPDAKNSVVAWFTMIPNHDGTKVIDIQENFEEISKMLNRLVDDESDIIGVSVSAPNGTILGSVGRKDHQDPAISKIEVEVPAFVSDCCECRVRGLVKEGDRYDYRFEATVSLHGLNAVLASLQKYLVWLLLGLLGLSLLISAAVSRVLLRRILQIRGAVDEIAKTGDFSQMIPTSNHPGDQDELNALASHFNRMFASIQKTQGELIEAKKTEARAAIASQVAHDIRSPLTSMTLAVNKLSGPPEMISILSHGISRVNGILKRLSKTYGKAAQEGAPVEPPRLTLVDKILFEVAQEHALKIPASQQFEITGFETVPQIWAVVQVTELQTALSNILNNAFEAVGPNGKVELSATLEKKEWKVSIRDNGVGIPAENLEKVFVREFTSGKPQGSGLGLYQAKKAVEWSGGKIAIESTVGVGTTLTITLPVEKRPSWLADELVVKKGQTLMVADDDPTILSTWRGKANVAGVPIREFATIGALDEKIPSLGSLENYVFVLDQYASDGAQGITGTALLEKHGIGARAYLSTSEFDDPAIQEKVKALKTRMIPKARLSALQIVVKIED